MQIPTAQPPSFDIEPRQDPYDIEMATRSEIFRSFISNIDRSKKFGASVKAMIDLAGNAVVKKNDRCRR